MLTRIAIAGTMVLSAGLAHADEAALNRWLQKVRITPVLKESDRHSIHAYFNTSPESPDGKWVVLYTSTTKEGHEGEVWIVERATGKTKVLARNVTTEDAHRTACQQWSADGKRVVFHDLRGGEWVVAAVDIESGEERILARNRHVGFGSPTGNVVPVVGLHWNPGKNTDLELIDTGTGAMRKIVTAEAVRKAFPAEVSALFGDRPLSIYFPVLSANGDRVFFKLATTLGGDFRSSKASERQGLICYDIRKERLLWMHKSWGHPAWHRDGDRIINIGPVVISAETGAVKRATGFPPFPGSHPSFSPDGLFTTDSIVDAKAGAWSVVIGDLSSGKSESIHRFDNSQGAASWRRSHPHPSFSADGKRLYFNVSADRWTRLYVAERE